MARIHPILMNPVQDTASSTVQTFRDVLNSEPDVRTPTTPVLVHPQDQERRIIMEYGIDFARNMFDSDKHVIVEDVDEWLEELGSADNNKAVQMDESVAEALSEHALDFVYVSRAFERISFFSASRHMFGSNDGWRKQRELAEYLLHARDVMHHASTGNTEIKHWPVEWTAFEAIQQQVKAGQPADDTFKECQKVLEFESDELVNLLHLAVSAGTDRLLSAIIWTHQQDRAYFHVKRINRLLTFLLEGTMAVAEGVSPGGSPTKSASGSAGWNRVRQSISASNAKGFVASGAKFVQRAFGGSQVEEDELCEVRRSRVRPRNYAININGVCTEANDVIEFRQHFLSECEECLNAWPEHLREELMEVLRAVVPLLVESDVDGSEADVAASVAQSLRSRVTEHVRNRYKCTCQKHGEAKTLCEKCLRSDLDLLTCSDYFGRTPLHFAVQHDRPKIVQFFCIDYFKALSQKRKTSSHDEELAWMRLLVLQKFLLATTTSGQTPLHFAARYDQPGQIFRLLSYIEASPSIFFTDTGDWHFSDIALDDAPMRQGTGDAPNEDADLLYPYFFRYLLQSAVEVSGSDRRCCCNAPLPYSHCHGKHVSDKWAQRNSNTADAPALRGIALEAVPEDLRHVIATELNSSQCVYRDMRDRSGQTPLHLACKMDRDTSALVLLHLGADPGSRDANLLPALYHMIVNIPNTAQQALDQFSIIDRSNRTQRDFVSFLLPQRLTDDIVIKRLRHRHDQAVLRKRLGKVQKREADETHTRGSVRQFTTRSARRSESASMSTVASRPQDRLRPQWWWYGFTYDQYREFFWGHKNTKFSIGDMYTYMQEDPPIDGVDVPSVHHEMPRRTILDLIVHHNRLQLVTKTVVARTVELMWNTFGFKLWCKSFFVYILFLAVWTTNAMLASEDERSDYTAARYVIEILSTLMVLSYIVSEVQEYRANASLTKTLKQTASVDFKNDVRDVAESWPDYFYLVARHADMFEEEADYLKSAWNYIDILTYALLLGAQLLQTIGVTTSSDVLIYIAVRVLLLGLIFAWVKLLKFARSFESIGPFVVMLGGMLKDTFRFLFLFLVLFVPFICAFMMVFGDAEEEGGYRPYGGSLRAAFSVFRITMVDYDYAILQEQDEVTSAVLVTIWLFFSAIVFLNLFIAMMANTFQQIADNATRISAMERASTVMQMLKEMTSTERDAIRIKILCDLEPDSKERFHATAYDDPDNEDSSLANIRLELLASVNRQHTTLMTLERGLITLAESEKRTRRALKVLNEDLQGLKRTLAQDDSPQGASPTRLGSSSSPSRSGSSFLS